MKWALLALIGATVFYGASFVVNMDAAKWDGCMYGCARQKLASPACDHLACDACQNTCEEF